MWSLRDRTGFVKVYAYSMEPVCLVMQYCAYGDLEHFVYGKGDLAVTAPYTKWRLINLFKQYCEGVGYMHAMGFVHCDIKPANVLITKHSSSALPLLILG